MARSLYISHPEVDIDPAVPTPQWGLSETGKARAHAFAQRGLLPTDVVFFSSTERKATDLAAILAAFTGARVITDAAFGENDRSSTGFLPSAAFEATADRFFAEPHVSVDGWETAASAQARIVAAVTAALADLPDGKRAVFCGHGAVGTLLKCHCGTRKISRDEDQRRCAHPGGGNAFVFDMSPPALHGDWVAMEALDSAVI